MPLGPDPTLFPPRRADWRVGPVVYQIFPDRFAPPTDRAAFAAHLTPPQRLVPWHHTPRKGRYLDADQIWSHEVAFWGGSLDGVRDRLDHLVGLGVDVLYLNPICPSLSNHRYDALDWHAVAPELGGERALRALIDGLHGHGIRLMLDGVFNHLGRRSPRFQRALVSPDSPERDWFSFREDGGYRGWYDVANLPEVRLEDPRVQAAVFSHPTSVVQQRLREGVDGWRLDVAHDLGPELLAALCAAAREANPDAHVVGEIWAYPGRWLASVDGLLNMHLRRLLLTFLDGALSGPRLGRLIATMIQDAGIEGMLRSWIVLDNHDTERLASRLPRTWQRRLAWLLQLTLPGSPVLYYGSEVGMKGMDDPSNRGPMRWDRVHSGHPDLSRLTALLAMRRSLPALRIGQCTVLDTDTLLGFMRTTERIEETVIVLVNHEDQPATERLVLPDSRLMTGTPLVDRLSGGGPVCTLDVGTTAVTVPARGARVLVPEIPTGSGYSPYRRIDPGSTAPRPITPPHFTGRQRKP